MRIPKELSTTLLLLAIGCQPASTAPAADLGDVRVQLALRSATLSADDTASLVIRLENAGHRAIAFEYQSRCHVALRVVEVVSGQELFVDEGGWQCGADLTGLAIPADGSRDLAVLLHAVSPMPGHLHGLHLAAGEYEVVAQITAGAQQVESAPLRFVAR